MKLSFGDIVKATGGKQVSGLNEEIFNGVSIDTRTIEKGEAFVAIKGKNFDGRNFLKAALEKGAAGLVLDEEEAEVYLKEFEKSTAIVTVEDTAQALGDLAAFTRKQRPVPLLAITGTAGKTTTKEMAARILSESRSVLKTEGNKNNLLGLPLTLLRLKEEDEAAVVELGISEPFEMDRLVEIAQPDAALITNIGLGHIEKLGTVERTASEKGRVFKGLKEGGLRVLNLDDEWAVRKSDEAGIEAGDMEDVISFSLYEEADVRVTETESRGVEGTRIIMEILGEKIEIELSVPGSVGVKNAAAAAAGALALGASAEDIKVGLTNVTTPPGRLEVVRVGGLMILDDTYNANPESVKAALEILSCAYAPRVAVFGDMLELGEHSNEEHEEAGRLAAESGVDRLFATGLWADKVISGAIKAGMNEENAVALSNKEAIIERLNNELSGSESVLVKGSRGAAMEEIVTALKLRALKFEH